MLKHVVCFKLKQGESVDKAIEVLSSMRGNVPMLIDMEVGKDFLHSPRSYDIILSVVLKDEKDLDAYQNDAYHVGVVKKHMHAVVESSVAVDFLF